jgi:hypothetical protein
MDKEQIQNRFIALAWSSSNYGVKAKEKPSKPDHWSAHYWAYNVKHESYNADQALKKEKC